MKEKKISEKNKSAKFFLFNLLLMFVLVSVVAVITWFISKNIVFIVRNCIFMFMGLLLITFLMKQALILKLLDYDNENHLMRFSISYLLSFIGMILCVFFPAQGWPFLAIYLVLTLFSNMIIGFTSASLLLLIAMFLCNTTTVDTFILYGLTGIITAGVFQKLDRKFKVAIPLSISIMGLILGLVVNDIFVINEKFSLELLIIPFCNVFITLVLCFIILKVFSNVVIYVEDDLYMEINDTEYELLVHLRETSKDEYFKAVHTAYFCYKIGTHLNFDADAIRACGYYHSMGKIEERKSLEDFKQLLEEHNFPTKVCDLLDEFLDRTKPIQQKEVVVLYLCDAVVSSIIHLKHKQTEENLNYEQIIDAIFKNRLDTKIFEQSDITYRQMNEMKKIFKEEKLYYDFLR